MDGKDFLRKIFEEISSKIDSKDISRRAMRSIGAGGKAFTDRSMEEFPRERIAAAIEAIYSQLANRDAAESLSAIITSFDERKISETLGQFVESLKDEKNSLQIARQIREILNQASNDQIIQSLRLLVANVAGENSHPVLIFDALSFQINHYLDTLRGASIEESAEFIRNMADEIPVDALASLLAAKTMEFTPEHIEEQVRALLGNLPSGQGLADAFHDAAAAASKAFDAVSKADDFSTAVNALQSMMGEAADAFIKGFNTGGSADSPIPTPQRRKSNPPRKNPTPPARGKGKGKDDKGGNFKM